MKLIDRAEQIGLTWPGTTRRARSILPQPKAKQNHNFCASIQQSTANNAMLFYTFLYTRHCKGHVVRKPVKPVV